MSKNILTLLKWWLYSLAVYVVVFLIFKPLSVLTGYDMSEAPVSGIAILGLTYGLASWEQWKKLRADDVTQSRCKRDGAEAPDGDKSSLE